MGIIFGILVWLTTILIVTLIGYGIIWLANFYFMPENDGYGAVLEKEFIPEHTTVEYNVALKMSMQKHHPDEWNLNISVVTLDGDLTDIVSVTREYYSTVNVNDRIHVKYKKGRLYKSINITELF